MLRFKASLNSIWNLLLMVLHMQMLWAPEYFLILEDSKRFTLLLPHSSPPSWAKTLNYLVVIQFNQKNKFKKIRAI